MIFGSHQSTIATSQEEVDALVLSAAPRQGQWSEEDYLWLSNHASVLIEFTDGYIEVLPMPTDRHQSLLLLLYRLFFAAVELHGGKVLIAPMRLRIRPGKYREPDLLLVRSAHNVRRQDQFWTGADLVLEVVSHDKPERDLVEKCGDYAEGGIPEYWTSIRSTKRSRSCGCRMMPMSNMERLGAARRRHRRCWRVSLSALTLSLTRSRRGMPWSNIFFPLPI